MITTENVNISRHDSDILNRQIIDMLVYFHKEYNARIERVLSARIDTYANDKLPNFDAATKNLRENTKWKCAPIAPGLEDRRVEITGPPTRKMVINALNSRATQYMIDFEDSLSPTWDNILTGHENVKDAVARTITYVDAGVDADVGKVYRLKQGHNHPVIHVRPRGLHMVEENFVVDGRAIRAALFDFVLHMYHNAHALIASGHGPYFYLPKLENCGEAQVWNDIFNSAEDYLQIVRGTIRATVLIETFPAIFQTNEILYELRHYAAGLNMGRWDYIFSFLKKMRNNELFVLPDRCNLTMSTTMMTAYARMIVKTCHARGVHAIGGMAANLPCKRDPIKHQYAVQKVRDDKIRECEMGCDGTWVLHPDFVDVALTIFDFLAPNQISKTLPDILHANDFLPGITEGSITQNGVKTNVEVSLVYIANWLTGIGCVAIDNCMEDMATMEISRMQIWQWLKHGKITQAEVNNFVDCVVADKLKRTFAEEQITKTVDIFHTLTAPECFHEFASTVCAN